MFKPGQSGNPAGKPPGATNKIVIAERVREAFSQLLDNNVDKLEEWLYAAAKKDPVKALDLWVRISERFVPMLSRTEITGADGQPFTPITINLPNIPKISLGEGAPTALSLSPAEEVKEIGEGTPAMIPVFLPEREAAKESEPIPQGDGDGSSRDSPQLWGGLIIRGGLGANSRNSPIPRQNQVLPHRPLQGWDKRIPQVAFFFF